MKAITTRQDALWKTHDAAVDVMQVARKTRDENPAEYEAAWTAYQVVYMRFRKELNPACKMDAEETKALAESIHIAEYVADINSEPYHSPAVSESVKSRRL